jgi:hypothetical protein
MSCLAGATVISISALGVADVPDSAVFHRDGHTRTVSFLGRSTRARVPGISLVPR